MLRKGLNFIVFILILGSAVVLFINLFLGLGLVHTEKELPLYDVQEVIQKNNKIYVGLGEYSRVQVYSMNGDYINSVKVNSYGKDFEFEVDEEGQIVIDVVYHSIRENLYQQLDGSTLSISSYPFEVRRIVEGESEETIIKQAFIMSLIGGFENGVYLLLFNLCLLFLINPGLADKILKWGDKSG